MNNKQCARCKSIKSLEHYGSNRQRKDSLQLYCKSCIRKARFESHLKYTYNLKLEDYNKMLEDQNYKCNICGSSNSSTSQHDRLVVDHNHKTGKIRGLLCDKCNRALGLFCDSKELLEKAIQHLKGIHNETNR